MRIPLSAPDITGAEADAVAAVLRSGRLSLGPKVAEFEGAVARYVDSPHAVAVNSSPRLMRPSAAPRRRARS